jgi:uncharacterized protein
VHTTIALQPGTHDQLLDLKRRFRLRSMDAVVRKLMEPPLSATTLFKQRHKDVHAVLKRYGVTRVVAFGSRARGEARHDSDLDLMVRLPAGSSLFDQANLIADLEDVFAMKVDVVTEGPHLGRMGERIRREGVVLLG